MSNHADQPSSNPSAPLLSTLASDPDMLELIQLFVEEIPERARALQDFWKRKEFVELRRIAHQIKGASGGYGFPSLGVAAGILEQQLNQVVEAKAEADLASVALQVDELVGLCNRVRVS